MRLTEIKKLNEQDPANYADNFSKLLKEVSPKEFSFNEVAYTFLGHDFKYVLEDLRKYRIQEGNDGGAVLPSTFKNISAFDATVAGLVSALVLEGYESPQFISDKFVEKVNRNLNGGKMVGVRNDGEPPVGQDLENGEPVPAIGMRETWINLPENVRKGSSIALNRNDFTYDLTGKIQEVAINSGLATRREVEIEVADMVLGITNTYSRENAGFSNTYQAVAAALPNDFVNSDNITLVDWTDIDEAIQLMNALTDPATGYEIDVSPDAMSILVMPQRIHQAKSIIRATEIRTGNAAANSMRLSENPFQNAYEVEASQIWFNRLVAAGVADPVEIWGLGNWKKAFGYNEILAFNFRTHTVGFEEARRDVVFTGVSMQEGTPFIKDPRFVSQFTIT